MMGFDEKVESNHILTYKYDIHAHTIQFSFFFMKKQVFRYPGCKISQVCLRLGKQNRHG